MKPTVAIAFLSALILVGQFAVAADPAPAPATTPRLIPPPAPPDKLLSAKDLAAIQTQLDALGKQIDSLRSDLANKPELLAYLPDVMIFDKAVRFPLADHEIVDAKEARAAIAEGMSRASALGEGKTPWETASGVRGYLSAIDGSVQPYLLELPAELPAARAGLRLDVSFHGRNELLTELKFVSGKPGQASDKIVLTCTAAIATPASLPARSMRSRRSRMWSDDTRSIKIVCSTSDSRWVGLRPGSSPRITPTFLQQRRRAGIRRVSPVSAYPS